MSQAWLQVAGLVFDIVGFGLIAWEWLIAQRHEARELAIETARARQDQAYAYLQRATRDANPAMQRHYEMSADMRRRRAEHEIDQTRRVYTGLRYRVVYAGMVAVVLGFVLQLLAAWPGCCGRRSRAAPARH